ncbi:MAG TPA: hypothetical protein EYP03_03740 [Aquificae bacterium]|nr:hypothetical protein [Aquificota bacterium]
MSRGEWLDQRIATETLKKVRQGFLEISKKKKKRIIVIDGNRELKKVFEEIKNLTLQKIKES